MLPRVLPKAVPQTGAGDHSAAEPEVDGTTVRPAAASHPGAQTAPRATAANAHFQGSTHLATDQKCLLKHYAKDLADGNDVRTTEAIARVAAQADS